MTTIPISRTEAKALGLRRYFTGKPCKHGHVAERLICNKGCVVCQALKVGNNKEYHREKNREWRKANPERFRAGVQAWTDANPERRKAISDNWYAANRERHRATTKARALANPERTRARRQAWYAANRERQNAATQAWYAANKARHRALCKAWAIANPEQAAANQRFHNAQRRALKARQTPAWADRKAIRAFYSACPPGHHVDHVVPIRGKNVSGLHVHYNLQYLTPPDNHSKGNRHE